MAISETKMQIAIANYFKDECDVNTSIRQAFEKGFRIGVKKGANMNRPQGKWIVHFDDLFPEESSIECPLCHEEQPLGIDDNYCPNCGAMMKGADDDTI